MQMNLGHQCSDDPMVDIRLIQKEQMMANMRDQRPAKLESEEYPRKAVQCEDGKTPEERGRKYAKLVTSPELAAFRVMNAAEQNSGIEKNIDVPTLMETLRDQVNAVSNQDLAQAEGMLLNQATALQSLFARLTEKAFSSEHLSQFNDFMRVALRAQNQCRATLETLSAIRNPPIVYARQANVTTGPQQINNGGPSSHAREIQNPPIQLSAEDNELRTDIRTSAVTSRINKEVEAMGEIHRPQDKRR
jgi:hypothetical protein